MAQEGRAYGAVGRGGPPGGFSISPAAIQYFPILGRHAADSGGEHEEGRRAPAVSRCYGRPRPTIRPNYGAALRFNLSARQIRVRRAVRSPYTIVASSRIHCLAGPPSVFRRDARWLFPRYMAGP